MQGLILYLPLIAVCCQREVITTILHIVSELPPSGYCQISAKMDSTLFSSGLPHFPRHGKLESTVRYLGIEVDDALEIWEQPDIKNRERRLHVRLLR